MQRSCQPMENTRKKSMKWIRPVVILTLTFAMTTGYMIGRVSGETFVGFATGLIVYWFKSRDEAKGNGGSDR